MKQLPILFSTPMVQAILEGRKTQTRRLTNLHLINQNAANWVPRIFKNIAPGREAYGQYHFQTKKGHQRVAFDSPDGKAIEFADCPYGKKGDILWVRETFGLMQLTDGYLVYKADDEKLIEHCDRWRPSIHMKKEDCRLWLQVKSVCVERLKDITEEDAIAEGVLKNCECGKACAECKDLDEWYNYTGGECDFPTYSAKESFQSLWALINGMVSWEVNPWVWVIEFERIENPTFTP
jgi:hypothetical protein